MRNLILLFRYLYYKIFSGHKYGHGIHSPFVYDLITNVFNDNKKYEEYNEIEKIRSNLCKSENTVSVTDFGAGSNKFKSNTRKIKDIAKYSSVNRKYGQLLFRLVKYFEPDTVVELGTSLGISAMYLAKGCKNTNIISIEANKNLLEIAGQNFNSAGLLNIKGINDSFENALPEIVNNSYKKLFIFIDGNHKKESTLRYYNQFLTKLHNNRIMIFDDINWSNGMREAWKEIKSDPGSKITIDLFFMGIVIFKKDIHKQNFVIRF